MKVYGRDMLKQKEWNRIFRFTVVTGLVVGFIISLLPQSFFYETALYYSNTGKSMAFSLLYRAYSSGTREFLYFTLRHSAYFLSIRLFLPMLFLIIGMTKKRTILPQFCIMFVLVAVSIQAALIFGSIGMEGWFRYQFIDLLPQSFYLLAVIRVYFFRKQEIHTVQSFVCGVFQTFSLLLCGTGLEICLNLLHYFQNVCIMS